MRAAMAFDATGVFYKSRRAIPRAKQALELLVKNRIPFVVLTNASDPTEQMRADFLNGLMDTNILKASHIIQGHTAIKLCMEQTKDQKGMTLIGGGVQAQGIAEEYQMKEYITVPELSACLPLLVPLDNKAGYPMHPEMLKQNALKRLNIKHVEEILERPFKDVMIFANPIVYEAHIQVVSDLMISSKGYLGTQRKSNEPQHVKLYYSHHDFLVPYQNANFPAHRSRYSLGVFKQSLDLIFKLQYGLNIDYELTGKPSNLAFDYARMTLAQQSNEKPENLKLYMVGDSPEIDILGGNQNGFDTILVKTGNYIDGVHHENPTHIVEDVYEAVEKVIKIHGL
eukprot:403334666